MQPRYLTKSRFKLALECPAKLFYTGKPEYADQKIEDPFLIALAEGGFQVGELAKLYYPGGYEIETKDYDTALRQTAELLKQENAVIFEAAFCWQNLFIRADILLKKGNAIELVEVKSKSFDPTQDEFLTAKGSIVSGWQPYLYDVAFQKYVVQRALLHCSVSAFLMLADKTARCPTNGLNQKFKFVTDEKGRKRVAVSGITEADLTTRLLCQINVDDCCRLIYSETFEAMIDQTVLADQPSRTDQAWQTAQTDHAVYTDQLGFSEYVAYLADHYRQDRKIAVYPSAACGGCEFKATEADLAAGLRCGFRECWKEQLGWVDHDFAEPNIFEIWDFRKKDKFLDAGLIKLNQLWEVDFSSAADKKPGLSRTQRQWLQVQKAKQRDPSYWIDRENLAREMSSWVFPLHFIDFETAMTAIPFNQNQYPYEGLAFQFSHHKVYADGRIEHCGQYLNAVPGVFPNYDFIRSLKRELEGDAGSIFRYAAHENTYLNLIYRQLHQEPDPGLVPDREELRTFIRTITRSVQYGPEQWEGERNMIDMLELVKRYYYDPAMKGSNSIKAVLPAVLNSSSFLQAKYAAPIYGADGGIPSLNFKDWQWIVRGQGRVIDPYKLLPRLFQDVSDKDLALISESDELRDGGAALTAYARMQFEEMSDYEREEISKALLKYCELDTFAMVLIYEAWREMVK